MGRALFLVNLLIGMACVGYVWSNLGSPYVRDVRKLFFVLNWFTMIRLEGLFSLSGHSDPSRLKDGVLEFLCSVPWWLYGFGIEVVSAKLRQDLGYSPEPEE